MRHLHTIIKEEVKKLYEAIMEEFENEDDACTKLRYIQRAMDLIILYDGGFTLDGFLDQLLIPEEREYYINVFNDEEYELTNC